MIVDQSAEIRSLRATVGDLLALSTIPEVWLGREPSVIVAELADVLIESLQLDFAFARLCDPNGLQIVEAMRGDSWKTFPEWLQQHLAVSGGQISQKEIVTNVGGVEGSCCGIVIPIGVNGERGLVAAASDRPDFPDQIDQQLLSVAANNAATAFQNAFLINELRSAQQALRANEHELRNARDELEIKVAERTSELNRSERELRDVIDTIPAIAWSALPDGSNSYVNSRFVEYCGMPPEQIAGSGWHAATHPDDLERHNAKWLACVGSGKPFEDEVRFRRVDGQYRWHLQRGVPLRDDAGNIVKWYGVVTDIEDRKRAEEARRRNEFYLAEGQRLGHTGSWAFNPSGFFEYWSRELFQIYGLNPQKGAPTLEQYLATIHPQDRDFMAETIKRMREQGSGCDAKKRIIRPDGAVRYIRWVGIPVLDNGVLKRFLGTAMDVTEQEQLTQELQRREAYLAEAQRLSQTGSWAWSPDQDIRYWSEECYRVLSFDPQDGLPRFEEFFQRIHPDDQPGFRELIQTAIREKAEWEAARCTCFC